MRDNNPRGEYIPLAYESCSIIHLILAVYPTGKVYDVFVPMFRKVEYFLLKTEKYTYIYGIYVYSIIRFGTNI